jgi:hypothetical protein
MGRTIPSFRLASGEEEREWKVFRNALDKSDRRIFDEMCSISHLYNSACSCSANAIRVQPIFMSTIFHHYKKLTRPSEQIKYEIPRLEIASIVDDRITLKLKESEIDENQ